MNVYDENYDLEIPDDGNDLYLDAYDDYDELEDEPEKEEDLEMRDYHPLRFKRYGKVGIWGGIMYAVFIISVSAILAVICWLFASDVLALNKDEITTVVTIQAYEGGEEISDGEETEADAEEESRTRAILTNLVDRVRHRDSDGEEEEEEEEDPYAGDPNVDINAVAKTLKDAGLIEYEFLFKLYSSFSHADYKIQPGTYELSTKFDYRALVKKMQIGSESQVVTTVTFPEGFTNEMIFARLEANNICSAEDLREAAATYNYTYSFLESVPMGESSRLEGFLFPDTYDFYEGMQASSALNKLLNNFYQKITAEMYEKAEEMGYSFYDCLIVASMIRQS